MNAIRPIHTDTEHKAALAEIEALWDAEPGTEEHDRLEVLGILVDTYESTRWPIDLPDPVEAIKFRMEQVGYRQKDLTELLGSKSRASEVLNRKRALTTKMIKKLHEAWGIPAEVLLG